MEDILSTIGNIEAYDIDGAGNNNITYKLRLLSHNKTLTMWGLIFFKFFRPVGNLTKPGLVSINSTTGQLRASGVIQCDIPKIYNLLYEVIVTDGVHETKGEV